MSDYKQDQRIHFKLDDKNEGWGTVAGFIGPLHLIIIKLETHRPNYPFSHYYVMETQIVDAPVEKPVVEIEVDDGL